MTQEEAVSELTELVEKEFGRVNAKLQELLDLVKEGITVYVEKVEA
jgi:hypothetical protein